MAHLVRPFTLFGQIVLIEEYDLPLEILERPKESEAETITIDDVLDLCLELERDEAGWIEKMKKRGK